MAAAATGTAISTRSGDIQIHAGADAYSRASSNSGLNTANGISHCSTITACAAATACCRSAYSIAAHGAVYRDVCITGSRAAQIGISSNGAASAHAFSTSSVPSVSSISARSAFATLAVSHIGCHTCSGACEADGAYGCRNADSVIAKATVAARAAVTACTALRGAAIIAGTASSTIAAVIDPNI
jgi:hypothetical protein